MIEVRPGYLLFRASGPHARETFQHETGGMRWQRVPPSEKRGRVHTSTVTVAVLPELDERDVPIHPDDLEWRTTRGSGAGGQHRNKTDSAVQLEHRPSGIMIRCEAERSQHQNRRLALAILRSRLKEIETERVQRALNQNRREQIGSGMRGDKVRTIRMQDGIVTDHRNGAKISLDRFLRGQWEGWLD